jgi:hypothetical protein
VNPRRPSRFLKMAEFRRPSKVPHSSFLSSLALQD